MQAYEKQDTEGNRTLIMMLSTGEVRVVKSAHPRYQELLDLGPEASDDEVLSILNRSERDLSNAIKLSEHLSLKDGAIYVDGKRSDDVIHDHIARMIEQGDNNYRNLVAFYENVLQNPSESSREDLFAWLRTVGMSSLDKNGYVLGYKGVTAHHTSIRSGYAYVNGELIRGQIPYAVGDVVTMDREDVSANREDACSSGLHIGNWRYASNFGDALMKVAFNPRDVVSVPSSEAEKLRVCRFVVLDVVEKAHGEFRETSFLMSSYGDDEYDWDDEDEDELDDCDCDDFEDCEYCENEDDRDDGIHVRLILS